MKTLAAFSEIVLADFEFQAEAGERPRPVCLVAYGLKTGRKWRLWCDEFTDRPPYPVDRDTLFVAYFASAELTCHLALGWPLPAYILDLYVEFKTQTNGLNTLNHSLLGALAYHGLDGIESAEKGSMRQLAMRGGEYTAEERKALLEYCETDVVALERLLPAMMPKISLEHALLRGRYMSAVARMEHTGVPIDTALLTTLRENWSGIKRGLVAAVDCDFGVYEDTTFKTAKFVEYLIRRQIKWPLLESGKPKLDDDTFRQMTALYPEFRPLKDLRYALGQLRLNDLAVGKDGRNRTLLSPYGTKTGRNTPSNSKFIFGPAAWLRSLIQPPPGRALAYVDWSQQEFGIAAALSGDLRMVEAYRSGDPYLAFGKQAGVIPPLATKQSHGQLRELFKTCALGTLYGIGPVALGAKTGKGLLEGQNLLSLHHLTYAQFWKWGDKVIDRAVINRRIQTVFGWAFHLTADLNPRSLRNFPMQGNGAEMLRLACIFATEAGVTVCAPVHDAVLIEAEIDEVTSDIDTMNRAMARASELVLAGFRLDTDTKVIAYPDHYQDRKGQAMWERIRAVLPAPGTATNDYDDACANSATDTCSTYKGTDTDKIISFIPAITY